MFVQQYAVQQCPLTPNPPIVTWPVAAWTPTLLSGTWHITWWIRRRLTPVAYCKASLLTNAGSRHQTGWTAISRCLWYVPAWCLYKDAGNEVREWLVRGVARDCLIGSVSPSWVHVRHSCLTANIYEESEFDGKLVGCWCFASWQHLRSYKDGYWLLTVCTHSHFIVLPHRAIRFPISHSVIRLSWHCANQSLP